MNETPTPTPELVALVSDDMVQAALDASDAYWSADARMEKCQACNGTGKVPCGESQDWCNCDGGTVNTGTEAGAMRAALDAYLATRAATLPQAVWLPIESAPKSVADGSRVEGVYLLGFIPDADACDLLSCMDTIWWEPLLPNNAGKRGKWCAGKSDIEVYPTHWQPLPTPPPAELGKGDDCGR